MAKTCRRIHPSLWHVISISYCNKGNTGSDTPCMLPCNMTCFQDTAETYLSSAAERFMTSYGSLLTVGFRDWTLFISVCGKNSELGHENDQRYANYEACISQRLRCPNLLLPVQRTDEPRKTGMKRRSAYLCVFALRDVKPSGTQIVYFFKW